MEAGSTSPTDAADCEPEAQSSSTPKSQSENVPKSPSIPEPPEDSPSPPRPPSLRIASEGSFASTMNPSSAPLGQVNAARRPGLPALRASGLSSDFAAKMKAFSLSRQGAPAQNLRPPPGAGHTLSTGSSVPSGAFAPGTVSQGGGQQNGEVPSPAGSLGGAREGLVLPRGIGRPPVPSWTSAPQVPGQSPRLMSPKPGVGGLAAKRGIKGGGMKLSDATGPPRAPSAGGSGGAPNGGTDTGSAFNKYSNIIDTQKGTLNFKNKAVIHGGGIEFTSGTSFSISLDEVDTLDELGKGNYGTVYKVRHSRPKMRRPGQGLRGNMLPRPSTSSLSSIASDDSAGSAPAITGTGTGTGIVMAMKEIRLELDDAKFAAIIMELDILHRCTSPFIVSFYGAFFQEGSVYICLEFMDGGSIDKLYGDGIPESVLKKITLSTIMGLRCLKDEHNIIHRDVKPTNILVNSRGQVKICDFGVSGNLVASIAKTNIGCQSYMAPERISGGGIAQAGANSGGGTYSVQSDIWSLGLTIIECAMGRYPYPPETYNNIFSQLSAIVDGDPPDLPNEGYGEAARSFVASCLHKIPKMRPTYAMLLRHAWLAPLLKPPTISEDGDAEAAAEAGASLDDDDASSQHPETADREIAKWVLNAMDRKASGRMGVAGKPALHAAPLDQVPGSPLLDREGLKSQPGMVSAQASPPKQPPAVDVEREEVRSEEAEAGTVPLRAETHGSAHVPLAVDGPAASPVLKEEKVASVDFADPAPVQSRRDGEAKVESEARSPEVGSNVQIPNEGDDEEGEKGAGTDGP